MLPCVENTKRSGDSDRERPSDSQDSVAQARECSERDDNGTGPLFAKPRRGSPPNSFHLRYANEDERCTAGVHMSPLWRASHFSRTPSVIQVVLQKLRVALGGTEVVPITKGECPPSEQSRVGRARCICQGRQRHGSVLSGGGMGISRTSTASADTAGRSEAIRPSVRNSSVVRVAAVVCGETALHVGRNFWCASYGASWAPSTCSGGRR